MKGFDSRFRDLQDYIITITDEIWEQRGLAKINDYYAADVLLETPAGVLRGVPPTIQNTAAMLQLFPDRRLLPHAVITSELPSFKGGISGKTRRPVYFSSHRIISTMHHRGAGIYGAPTNRRIKVFTIADCMCSENQIFHEWLVRDNLAIVKQLGLDPQEFAAELVEQQGAPATAAKASQPGKQVRGGKSSAASSATKLTDLNNIIKQQHLTHLSTKAQDELLGYLQALNAIRGRSEVAAIARVYHPAADLHLPGGITDYGIEGAENFYLPYLGAFSAHKFSIEQVTAKESKHKPLEVAVRWRLSGVHNGPGKFGPANNKPVEILAITHCELQQGQVIREWNLIDELAILCQVI